MNRERNTQSLPNFIQCDDSVVGDGDGNEEDIDDGNDFKSRKHGIPFTAPSMEGHIVTHIQSTNAMCLPLLLTWSLSFIQLSVYFYHEDKKKTFLDINLLRVRVMYIKLIKYDSIA